MFLNPLLLIGLSAAVLPVVLHLLSRARYRSVDWGAMMFLEGTDPRQQQSSRMNQVVLLLIRSAVVGLLAVALARPVVRGKFAAPGLGQKLTAVILLDCSASMGFDENGTPRMVHAKAAAKQVLALHKGDRVSLVLMGQEQAPEERRPTTDLWDVGRRVEAAEPGAGRADVAAALMDAAALVGGAPRPPAGGRGGEPPRVADRESVSFYVITDHQAGNWREVDESFPRRFADALSRAGPANQARLFVLPVGGNDAENAAVEAVTLLNAPAVVGQPAEIEVRIKNYGSVSWPSLPLLVTTAGADRTRVIDTKVSLGAGASLTLRERVRYREPGTHVITAQLNRNAAGAGRAAATPPVKPTGFTSDDKLEAVVDVIEPIQVLVISGDERVQPGGATGGGASPTILRGESDYLRFALAPFKAAKREGPDLCKVDVAGADRWAGPTVSLGAGKPPGDGSGNAADRALGDYQVLVLANVEQFTPRQVLAVEQFVYDGGGLLIAPGALSRASHYNDVLYKEGSGVMPARLLEATAADGTQETSLSGFDQKHPVFQFLGGRPDPFLSAVIGRYFRVAGVGSAFEGAGQIGPAGAGADASAARGRVLAQFVTGDPFLIEPASGEVGRGGRVLLMTTSLDADWSTLPTSSFYLPFVQSAVRYLADTSSLRTVLAPGEVFELPVDPTVGERAIRVVTPENQERPARTSQRGGATFLRFADTQQPGLYQVKIDPGKRPVHFVVRGSQEESDLTTLPPERWEWLRRSLNAEKLDTADRPISASAAGATGSHELWGGLVGAVLLLAVAEMALARRWAPQGAGEGDGFDPVTPAA